LLAREGQQSLREFGRAVRRAHDHFGELAVRDVSLQRLLQELRVAQDDGEHIVEIMGHAAGELSNSIQSMRLP
jgi:hypothetical protein